MAVNKLVQPRNVVINFEPSKRQYEAWKMLQPECPHCGGEILQEYIGNDKDGNPEYKPMCSSCGSQNIPQIILEGGAAGGGKALVLGSLVATPFGFRLIDDLKKGDIISNPKTGKMQKIVKVHPIEKHPYYRVKFVDGTHTDCSEGHLWQCHVSRNRSKRSINNNLSLDTVWETIDMFQWYERKKSGMYNGCNLIIPLTEPVQFTVASHLRPIDPYVLGALIGDGYMGATKKQDKVSFTSMDDEIKDRFESCGYDMSKYIIDQYHGRAKVFDIRDDQLVKYLRKTGLSECNSQNLFIPRNYQLATIDERIKLMQGLIDTDGYVDERGHITYTTTSKQLADDVAFVVRSLGGVATITQNKAGYSKDDIYVECSDAYNVQIRTKMNPDLCGISRKKERARYEFNGGNSELGKRIVDIEYIGEREGRCITVDDPSGLYVTDNFTVTHNSYLGSCWLVSCCMRFPDIRAVVGRKTLKSLRESTWNTILSVLKKWGLKEDVNYKINNLEGTITFWNDSVILMKEMCELPSDPNYERFGSSEYTIAFIDEVSEISERAIEVLFSRLRWKTHETFKVAKLLMSTNPTTNWVRSRFVQDDNRDPAILAEGEFYVRFTVYDNPDIKFRQTYVAGLQKIKDQATKERLLYGNWDFVESNDMACYPKFNGEVHLVAGLRERKYDPTRPLITSWDFNVAPYMTCLICQVNYDTREVFVLEESIGLPKLKENNTPAMSRKVKERIQGYKHTGIVDVTGDPAGLQKSTSTEDGVNNYTILINNLSTKQFKTRQKLLSSQPAHTARLEFVNEVFSFFDGWKIYIDLRCRKLTDDLIYQTKNEDGTKSKQKVTDPITKIKYEKYGHASDCLDYLLCLYLRESFSKYKNCNNNDGMTTIVSAKIPNVFEY